MGKTETIFKNNLVTAMRKNNLNARELADALGLARGTVAKWASGENWPSPDNLDNLASALSVPVPWLLADHSTERLRAALIERVPALNKTQVSEALLVAGLDPDMIKALETGETPVQELAHLGKSKN